MLLAPVVVDPVSPLRASQLGQKLQTLVSDFYDRVFDDLMIGYLFKGKDKQRLVQKEWELIMNLLGQNVSYTGRSLGPLHQLLKIQGGHFDRRLQIMKECLQDHAIDPEVIEKIVSDSQRMRATIVADPQGRCF